MEGKWINVTEELFNITSNFEFLDTVLHQNIDLEETMHAHEINDNKIDPKWDIKEEYTISKMLENGQIKTPDTLSVKDMKNIFAQVFKMQTLILQTQPFHQTIYTFSYLYDDNIWKNSLIMSALMQSINTLGMYIFQLHKTACSLKEDDLNISTYAFKKFAKSHDQVSQLLLKAEKQIQSKLKGQKQAEVLIQGRQLIGYIKLRRSLHLFIKQLGSSYEAKNQGKIEGELKTLKKRLIEQQTLVEKNNLKEEVPENVFNNLLPKTLRSNFGWKPLKPQTLPDAFAQIDNMISQLELFLPPPLKLSDYRHRLDILSYKRINLLSKSYFKANFFAKQNYLMNSVKTEQALVNDINEWNHVSADIRQHEKFINLISLSAPSMSDSLYKQLGRNTRWFWQISKVYEDTNVLIHICTEIDNIIQEKKKESFIASWYYNYATTIMIRQILWGFEQDLYEVSEYHYVAYYLEYILFVNEKNNNYFTNKLDKSILENFHNKTLSKKQKKHLSEGEKRFLADSLFFKGLHYYIRAFYRLLVLLISREHINDPFKSSQELRINNRFRIFKNIMFMKKLNHQTFEKEFELIVSDQGKILDEATQLLKSAKSIFGNFSQFDENQTHYRQCQEAIVLEKLSVKLSLVVMTLKFKQKKQFSIRKEYPKYPQIHIQ